MSCHVISCHVMSCLPSRAQDLLLLVGCLTSQQHARVSRERICSDNCTCCPTEIEVADRTCYLTQSQYTRHGNNQFLLWPYNIGAWQFSHWSHFTFSLIPIVYLTVGAPRMIGQPLFSILLCFRPFEGLHPTLILSTPLCCLPISFSVCLSFSLLVQYPVGSSLQVLLILFCAHTISVFVSSQW